MGTASTNVLLLVIAFNLVGQLRSFGDPNIEIIDNDGTYLQHFLENATSGYDQNLQACDCGWKNAPKRLEIVGGFETGVNEFPSMAALINLNSGTLYCGSIIISNRYLLTAAHCVYQRAASTLAVLVGDHNISSSSDTPYSALYLISAYELNPGYNPNTFSNDIAILQTKTTITFSSFVGPICLPFRYSTANFASQPVQILGWGQIEFSGPTSDVLLKATLGVISNPECARAQTETIEEGELCTYASGRDSCQSDSGGPVLWTDTRISRMYHVGVISHGVGCATRSPGINTRVTTYLNWITSRTSDASYCYM